jgi:hypothetical protein
MTPNQADYSIQKTSRLPGVTCSGFNANHNRPPSNRQAAEEALTEHRYNP